MANELDIAFLVVRRCQRSIHAFCLQSPRAKLTLVLNLCRIASELAAALYKKQSNGVLDEQQIATTGASVIVAADDLLPVLIWLLIRSKPRNLLSSLEFISVFRLPSLLMSEDLYFFTMVASAVRFTSIESDEF